MKLLLLLCVPVFSFSQGMLSLPEMNVLYANYNNKIEIGTGSYKKRHIVVGEGVSLTLSDTKNEFIGRVTGSQRTARVHVVSKNGKDTLSTREFRVMRLPPPILSLGYTFEDDTIHTLDSVLHLNHSLNVNFYDETYLILDYSLLIMDYEVQEFKVTGNTLTPGILSVIRNIPKEDRPKTIYIKVNYKGPDNSVRLKVGKFVLT